MEGAISDTFLIIRDFIHTELGENPQELLGDAAWAKLLSVSEVFEKERDLCQKALSAIDWESDALAEAVLELACVDGLSNKKAFSAHVVRTAIKTIDAPDFPLWSERRTQLRGEQYGGGVHFKCGLRNGGMLNAAFGELRRDVVTA
jgi:hypothetical protein